MAYYVILLALCGCAAENRGTQKGFELDPNLNVVGYNSEFGIGAALVVALAVCSPTVLGLFAMFLAWRLTRMSHERALRRMAAVKPRYEESEQREST